MPDKASAFVLNGAAGDGDADKPGSTEKRLRRTLTQLGAWRVVLTTLVMGLALLVARYSGEWPLIDEAEQALYDLRALLASPLVEQDQRITMVTYNDEVLIQRRVRSPLDRALLADALKTLDSMGAKSVGVDILFDQETDADLALAAQLRAMRTPTFIAYATPESNPNNIQQLQADFLRSFIAAVATGTTRPGQRR
jgi:adenylate cyclase